MRIETTIDLALDQPLRAASTISFGPEDLPNLVERVRRAFPEYGKRIQAARIRDNRLELDLDAPVLGTVEASLGLAPF